MHTKGRWKNALIASIVLMVLCMLVPQGAAATPVQEELQRLTHYAQEYEIGTITYAQFSVYLASVQKRLQAALGATRLGHDEVLTAAQLEAALGSPTERTSSLWIEKEDREKRLDKDIPAWRTVVFDGNKVQIRLNAWPHVRRAEDTNVRYRLNTEIVFKKPAEAFDAQAAITKVHRLAETYNAAPTSENAETLARESVAAERRFSEMLERAPAQCEATIISILGADVQRREQKTVRQEIVLYEGKNYEGMLNYETCLECEWFWINMHAQVNTRGRRYPGMNEVTNPAQDAREAYRGYTDEQFKQEITAAVAGMRHALERKESIQAADTKLRVLNEAWNEKANNVHEVIEARFRAQRESLPSAALQAYDWQAEERERRALEQALRKLTHEDRQRFYRELFAGYPTKSHLVREQNFERRLIETSRTVTSELCSNKKDDDGDTAVDCADTQCGGSWCGSTDLALSEQGINVTVRRDLYCVQSACALKPDAYTLQPGEIAQALQRTRVLCKQHPPLACIGTVLFKGKDAHGCPLPPVCIAEQSACAQDADCAQPRCGTTACIEGACKVTGLEACRERACTDGTQRTLACATGETLVTDLCIQGSWQSTGQSCVPHATQPTESTPSSPAVTLPMLPQCSAKEECAAHEVCSTGQCIPLPTLEQPPAQPEKPSLERTPSPASPATPTPASADAPQETNALAPTTPEKPAPAAPPAASPAPEPSPPPAETSPSAAPPAPTATGALLSPVLALRAFITGLVAADTNESAVNATTSEVNASSSEEKAAAPDNVTLANTTRAAPAPALSQNESQTAPPQQNASQGERRKTNFSQPPASQRNESSPGLAPKPNSEQPQEQPHTYQEQLGVFQIGGTCRQLSERHEGNIHFGGWGKPFEALEPLKQNYYRTSEDWCKREYENLLKQRAEFEASFNEKFAAWFFEEYMANAADDWETHMSGIFDLYWRDVELSRQLAQRLDCLNQKTLPPHTLLTVNYETTYGKIEFWEEIKHAKLNPNDDEAQDVISPYMRIFVFPPKHFIKHELREAMEARQFPGSPDEQEERAAEEGLTEAEKARIRQDEKFMATLRKTVQPYDGDLDASFRMIDANGSVVFNLYAQVNEADIMKLQPMPPEAQPAKDVTVSLDFDEVYELIDFIQREMEGGHLESPPWDSRPRRVVDGAREMYNGIRVWLKLQGILSNAQVTPQSSEQEVKAFIKATIWKMMTEGDRENNGREAGREADLDTGQDTQPGQRNPRDANLPPGPLDEKDVKKSQ